MTRMKLKTVKDLEDVAKGGEVYVKVDPWIEGIRKMKTPSWACPHNDHTSPMNIINWFDPANIDHLKAYRALQKTGMWPQGFLPEGIIRTTNWAIMVASKIADHHVDMMLNMAGEP